MRRIYAFRNRFLFAVNAIIIASNSYPTIDKIDRWTVAAWPKRPRCAAPAIEVASMRRHAPPGRLGIQTSCITRHWP
ncbi:MULTISPECIES: hypothetical protein [unclassified Mesorhizobium]|uniref:hypothetical protein n=1 Tax=unclassified Mesorhizobium TaxID=325217 RepID=UPI0019285E87|nr:MULTISPECIES: hypothetical protein [unclassified Mesorhizobium]